MRRHVVDAGVVIKWFVEEVQADQARELQDDQYELFAPDLLWPESGNILWKKVQRGELMADEARLICAGLLKQPITFSLQVWCLSRRWKSPSKLAAQFTTVAISLWRC